MALMSLTRMLQPGRDKTAIAAPPRKSRPLVLAMMLVTVLASAGQASAQLPDDASAVDQYVEDLPGAGGSSGVGVGKGGTGGTGSGSGVRLSSVAASALQQYGGRDAEILREVATSPVYGAPQDRLGGKKVSRDTRERIHSGEFDPGGASAGLSPGDAVTAAVGAVEGGDSARLAGLLAALLIISGGGLAAVALRYRRGSF